MWTGVAGTPGYTNMYFDADTSSAGAYQTLVLGFWAAINPHIRSTATATMVNPIPIIDVATGEVVDVAIGDGGTQTGGGGDDLLPPATSGLLQLHTGVFVSGREIRGRNFIPYPTEPDSTNGVPIAAYMSDIADSANELQDVSHANGAWVVYSRAHARFESITTPSVWGQWASLRSRRD